MPIAIFSAFDVVVVPFPFVDRHASKRRPAVVVSREAFQRSHGHAVLAMVTSVGHAAWPSDIVMDHAAAGLRAPSKIRMKLFTLDLRLIAGRLGTLAAPDQAALAAALRDTLP